MGSIQYPGRCPRCGGNPYLTCTCVFQAAQGQQKETLEAQSMTCMACGSTSYSTTGEPEICLVCGSKLLVKMLPEPNK